MFFNMIKTFLLLGMLSALLIFLGGLIGGSNGIHMALIIALIVNSVTYFFSDSIVLTMYRAQPLDRNKYGQIYATVKELCTSMHIPEPKLWLVNNTMANAFATGRNPGHASIALTTGILSLLDMYELRGVLAHELAHIKNRDILVSTIAAVLATAVSYLATLLRWSAFWGTTGSDSRQRKQHNPIVLFIVALIVPMAATLLQLALSRSREYLADETGACCSQEPLALASALEKLDSHIKNAHLNPEDTRYTSTAGLFIVHPFTGGSWSTLFSTHPPMPKRIARLRDLYTKMFRSR